MRGKFTWILRSRREALRRTEADDDRMLTLRAHTCIETKCSGSYVTATSVHSTEKLRIWTRKTGSVWISYMQPIDRFVVHEKPHPPSIADVVEKIRTQAPLYSRFIDFSAISLQSVRVGPFIELCIETTTKCNLRCNVCISDSSPQRSEFLALSDLQRIVSSSARPLRVTLTGGEFFVRPDWKEVTDYLLDFGAGLVISTNGTLLTERTVSYFLNTPTVFALSLDGLESTHDTLRHQIGNFQAVWNSLRALKDAGIPTHVYSVLQEANKAELLPLSLQLAEMEIVEHRIMNVIQRGRGGDLGIPTQSEMRVALEKLRLPHLVTQKSRQHAFPLVHANGQLEWLNLRGPANGDQYITYLT